MNFTIKISKIIGFYICCALCLTFCTDDPPIDPPIDPPTETYTVTPGAEEAFPGIHGEILEFIIEGDTVVVEKINGNYVYQADIFLTEDQLTSGVKKGAGINSDYKQWHCNTVYYKINDNLLHMSGEISAAIQHYESNTHLIFKERTVEKNYVEFVSHESGCKSNLGMTGGRQTIWICDKWATTGVIIHEIGHTIGLIHEHTRKDRKDDIMVIYDNIIDSMRHNFYMRAARYKTSFDFNSIMLYSSFAFSIDKATKPTILRKNPFGPYEAQREELSSDDIGVINKIYPELPDVCALDSIKDIDGNYYPIIEIGTQVWMAENLKTTTYNDGSPIPLITDMYDWENSAIEAYCWFLNDETTYKEQGALYKWYSINTGKLCPKGWHVPSNSDWITLIDYLGGYDVAGGLMKETGTLNWRSPNVDATDAYCFKALPNGGRSYSGWWYEEEASGAWWSLSEADSDNDQINLHMAYAGMIYNDSPGVSVIFSYKVSGMCVRCLED